MPMHVVNLLAALFAGVGDQPKTTLGIGIHALLQRQLGHQHHHAAQHGGVLRLGLGQRGNVGFGNDEEMHRRPRVDVVEREQLFVFIDFFAGNFPRDDFAKDAIWIGVNVELC